jgi:hypothetical protein
MAKLCALLNRLSYAGRNDGEKKKKNAYNLMLLNNQRFICHTVSTAWFALPSV